MVALKWKQSRRFSHCLVAENIKSCQKIWNDCHSAGPLNLSANEQITMMTASVTELVELTTTQQTVTNKKKYKTNTFQFVVFHRHRQKDSKTNQFCSSFYASRCLVHVFTLVCVRIKYQNKSWNLLFVFERCNLAQMFPSFFKHILSSKSDSDLQNNLLWFVINAISFVDTSVLMIF